MVSIVIAMVIIKLICCSGIEDSDSDSDGDIFHLDFSQE